MKLKNKLYLILLIALPPVIVLFFITYYNNYRSTHFSCTADYSAISGRGLFVSKNSLIIDGNNGTWMMDGKISYNNVKPYFFKLRNNFEVHKKKFSYHFKTQKVSITSEHEQYDYKLSDFLANIITTEGSESFFYIYPINNSYLIYSGEMPVMYCMKTN